MPLRVSITRALVATGAAVLLPWSAASAPAGAAPAHVAPAHVARAHVAPAHNAPAAATVAPARDTTAAGDGLLRRIRSLGIVSSVEEVTEDVPDGFRFFRIDVTQPVDHDKPDGRTFTQRITLLHRGLHRPTVMFTSGYNLYGVPFRSEPTAIVDGNQIEMEYRFFSPSRPKRPDWAKQLTIAQAAADEHRIIKAFKKIYHRNWLTTGGSKGGMTATYHRRFYPDDVDGTIPYVAPNDVVDDDDVYNEFLSTVGGAGRAGCRQAIVDVERRMLGSDRAWFRDAFDEEVEAAGYTFDIVGDPDVAFETSVVDLFFGFWQYQPPSACADVPGAGASRAEVLGWFEDLNGEIGGYYADQGLRGFVPYYFQASYQLGAPEPYEDPISDLLQHPGADVARTFVPDRLLDGLSFDDAAMPDIDQWVREDSRRMLYVYGEYDPWSAEPFQCSDDPAGTTEQGAGHQCFRFYEPGGNHGSSIEGLSAADQERAVRLVRKWAGLSPTTSSKAGWTPVPALDDGWQRAFLRR